MCIIDHKNKIIFVAIPKTASTSLRFFLKSILSKDNNQIEIYKNETVNKKGFKKHSTAKEISSRIKNYSEYTSVAVVRNPFDWYVSWYTYRMRKDSFYQTSEMTFKEYLNKQPMKEILSFVSDENGKIIVDHIIRFEDNIEEQIKKILSCKDSLQLNKSMDKINASKKRIHKDYKKYYDEETRKIVEKLQIKSLKQFGYKF